MALAYVDTHRPHGSYVKYVVEKCRCLPCTEARRAYERNRRRAMARPDELWLPYVPAGRARRHLAELSTAGVGQKRVAEVSGVPHGSIAKIVYGDPRRGMAPSRRIRLETERRILAVSIADAADRAKIDARPTWELLDELVARGFTKTWLAKMLGMKCPALQLGRHRVTAANARKVARLHKRLDGMKGPGRKSRWA